MKGLVSTDTKKPNVFFKVEENGLEGVLEELRSYGHPKLLSNERGWWCYIDVFVTGTGVEFSVKSESSHSDPISAAKQCYKRLMKELKSIKETV